MKMKENDNENIMNEEEESNVKKSMCENMWKWRRRSSSNDVYMWRKCGEENIEVLMKRKVVGKMKK